MNQSPRSQQLERSWRTRTVALGFACALACFAIAWALPVFAQKAHATSATHAASAALDSVTPVELATQALFEGAEAAARRADWAQAKRYLSELFRRDPGFAVTSSLADVELKLRDYLHAAEHAQRALDLLPATAPARTRSDLERIFSAASAHLGMLEITTVPSAAGIVLDGERSHLSPLITPGTHEVRATLTGYLDATARVLVQRQQVVQLTLTLQPAPHASAPKGLLIPPPTRERPRDVVARGATPSIALRERNVPTSSASAPGRNTLLAVGGGAALITAGFGAWYIDFGTAGTERHGASSWLLTSAGLSLATSISWQLWGAVSLDSQRSYLNEMFLAGSSPGAPSTAKVVTVSGLHLATLTTLGVGIWKAIDFQSQLGTDDETAQLDLDRKATVGLLASAGLLHVLSQMAAEWWPNINTGGGQNVATR